MGLPSTHKPSGSKARKLCGAILGGLGLLMLAPVIHAQDKGNVVTIDLSKPAASNIPKITDCFKNGKWVFKQPAGKDINQTFTVQFPFHVAASGNYVPAFKGRGAGTRTYSRFSYSIDGGKAQEALARRVSSPENGPGFGWQDQPVMALKEGDHVLELQFRPDQQVLVMNRIGELPDGHSVDIEGIQFTPAPPAPAAAKRSSDQHLLWKNGDTVVFFGDSITDEGLYLQQLTRLLKAAYPSEDIKCINAGIALNRTWEGVARMDLDVIALKPQWAVLAFGVNDGMHMSPSEFAKNYSKIVQALKAAKIGVICVTPTGMLPALGTKQQYFFHAPDRAAGFDRTMKYNAAAVQEMAKQSGYPLADALGGFLGMGDKRAVYMTNQWHPNEEGGLLMALSILRAAGFSEADVARSGNARDLELYKLLVQDKDPGYTVFKPRESKPAAWPAGPVVAATSFSLDQVIFADDATGAEIARVPVGSHPVGLAYSPKRKTLYVACEGAGQLDAIRIPECTLEKSIKLGDVYPIAVVLSEDQNTAWTGNFFGSSISEIDLNTGKVNRVIKVGSIIESLVYLPEQKRFLAATHDGLKLVDPEKGVVEKTLVLMKPLEGAKESMVDHHDAFLWGKDGTLYAIDTTNWTQTAIKLPELTAGETQPCAWPGRASAAREGAAGRWVADGAKGELVRIDDGEKTPIRTPEVDNSFGITIIPKQ